MLISSRWILLFLAAFILGSCAHHKDVRPGADGIHRVVIVTDDTEGGARKCIKEANHFCKEQNKYAAFVSEDKKYTNSMDEDDYHAAKVASRAAQAVGGAVWVFGGRAAKPLGGILGIGGTVANEAIGKGYTVEMRFRCQ